MASLTEISVATRKFFFGLVIAFIVYLVLRFLIGMIVNSLPPPTPPPPEPPNVLFNKISTSRFPKTAISSSGMTFILENIEGKLPEATTSAKVYSMPKKLPSFLTSERAKNFAAKLGFTKDPELISSYYYRFTDPNNQLRTLELDSVNMNFHLKFDYTHNYEIFNHQQLIQRDQIVSEIKNFIGSNGLFDASILGGKITSQLLTFDPASKNFNPAISLSAANALAVNFFRQDLDGMKLLPPSFNKSYNFSFYVPSPDVSNRILEISYTFWPIDFNNFATYPLRSTTTAWQDLIDGYAYVINMGNNPPDKIVIRNIYLAYYDSEESRPYLQPIFVFEGDNDFVAYLPALDSSWLE